MVTRSDIIIEARKHLGTRFHHQGRAPGAGLDCLGLIVVTGRALGLHVIDRTDYAASPDGLSLVKEISQSLDGPYALSTAKLGSILLFEFVKGLPQHVGIATDIGIIHALATEPRKVCETRLDEQWRERVVSVWEFRGLEN